MVEIDQGVIDACKEHMPSLNAGAFNDPRVTLYIQDAFAFVKQATEPYDMVVMDTANLKYRYVTDTVLLKDRETPGDDGKVEEYLTEAGLEVHHPDTFFWLKGILGGAKGVAIGRAMGRQARKAMRLPATTTDWAAPGSAPGRVPRRSEP